VETKNKRRVGLLGGAYDPIHNGHLILADYAKRELNLDNIIFIPCNNSAYTHKNITTHAQDRVEMLKLALGNNYDINQYELLRGGISYTIDTIKFFTSYCKDTEFTWIAGADSIANFNAWKDSKEILKLVDVKFATKDFYSPQIGITSTLIRYLIKKDKSIKYLVPKLVEEYIINHKLYK